MPGEPKAATRYGRVRALLHWVLAAATLAMLAVGLLVIGPMSDDDPAKVAVVRAHMVIGFGIFAILHVTIPMAYKRRGPAPLASGSPVLDRLATLAHHGLRLATGTIVISGLVTALLAGLPEVAFEGTADRIPAMTRGLVSFKVHAALAWVMVALVALHIAGALFHALVKRDGIFARMSIFRS